MSKDGDDFREAAERESVALVGEDILVPPLDLGLSLCHPIPDPPSRARSALYLIGGLVVGFTGIGAGTLILAIGGSQPGNAAANDWVSLTLGMCCTLGGLAALFGGVFVSRGWVRRQLGERGQPQSLPDGTKAKPHRIGIEDAATFEKMKLHPEDEGHLFLDPARHAVLIEGLSHRYTIFREDLVAMIQVFANGSLGVRIIYYVGDATLDMTVSQVDSFKHQLRAQTIGAKTAPLLSELRAVLGDDGDDDDDSL